MTPNAARLRAYKATPEGQEATKRSSRKYRQSAKGRARKKLDYEKSRGKPKTPARIASCKRAWMKQAEKAKARNKEIREQRAEWLLTSEGQIWRAMWRATKRAQQKVRKAKPGYRARRAERLARPEAKARARRYQQSPAGRIAAAAVAHRRRARSAEPVDKTALALIMAQRICYYCGVGLDPKASRWFTCRTTIDHRTPISRGGMNAAENLAAACASCNSRKNRKTESEFLALLRGIPYNEAA